MLRLAVLVGLLVSTALAGCGAGTNAVRLDVHHPANPCAPAAPTAASAFRLQPDEFDQAVLPAAPGGAADSSTAPGAPKTLVEPSAHRHPASGAGKTPPAMHTTHRPGPTTTPQPREPAIYACPMHPDITDTTASSCPKCGMTLVRRREQP
jgi:hypothetical protein